uniref:Tissue factor pathway inhibitor n=1 Tax=Rhipicephalus appendiculatus TaxID=34631 RepID=A0A131YQE9_RHIAP
MFFYSGCGGNDNRFSKEGWCQWYCLQRNKMRKSVCSRRPYGEKCYGRTERWYFDKYANTCRQFKNGYCGLVPNRFETCWQCINRCSEEYASLIVMAAAEEKETTRLNRVFNA